MRVLCRITRLHDYLLEADSSQQILVSDTGNNHTLLTSRWHVQKCSHWTQGHDDWGSCLQECW